VDIRKTFGPGLSGQKKKWLRTPPYPIQATINQGLIEILLQEKF